MTPLLYVVIAILAIAAVYFIFPAVVGTYLKFRGTRVITCPETRRPAAVDVDVARAALSAALGKRELTLKDCSRWPEREPCGQECLLQVEAWPEECLVGNMVKEWYRDKKCVFCGTGFEEDYWLEHKPALLGPDGKTREWAEVRPELLPDVLSTHKPVCWNCHIAETFRREHPELVVDRDYLNSAHV
jgi:hypothetical protein